MDATVTYRLLHRTSLPCGPVSIILTPSSSIKVLIDEAYMDPMLAAAFEHISNAIMEPRERLDVPPPSPVTQLRIERVRDTGNGIIAAEVAPASINILIDRELARPELPSLLVPQGARILRHFT